MNQAEITAIATLASTLIAAVIIVWQQMHVSAKVDSNTNKTQDTQNTVSEVKQLVNGTTSTLLAIITALRAELADKNNQLIDKSTDKTK